MAEQAENSQPQQAPFTEKGIVRMKEWLTSAPSLEVNKLPQPNINRLFLLRELRSEGYSLGFEEKTKPKYEVEGDKNSDIVMEWDTFDHEDLKLRLQLDGLVSSMQTQYVGIDTNNPDHSTIRFINEMIGIRNQLMEDGINIAPTLIDAKGAIIDLPEDEIKRKITVELEMPPTVPLRDQEFSFDPHTGAWYGSPKTKTG